MPLGDVADPPKSKHRPMVRPAPGAVDAWFVIPAVDEDTDAAFILLDAEERRRGDDLALERRRNFILARAALRLLVADYLDVPATGLTFDYGARGKPYLPPPHDGLRFNVSHGHGRILIAFAADEIGVDVEINRRRRLETSAHKTLPLFDGARRRVVDDPNRIAGALWTRQEAYLKATGIGIGVGRAEWTAIRRWVAGAATDGASSWSIYDLDAGPAHSAAICVRGSGHRMAVRAVSMAGLLRRRDENER